MKEQLEEQGYYIYRDAVNPLWIAALKEGIDESFRKDNKAVSVSAHCILYDKVFINFLEYLMVKPIFKDIQKNYFDSLFILNSMSALRIDKDKESFSSAVHRDVRFFTGNCNLMLNMMIMIDDFTPENGATWVYPKTHLKDINYIDKKIQVEGKAGDIIIWNSNLLHKSGQNYTNNVRRGLAITFSKSCYKQLLNYPKALQNKEYTEEIKQLLGYNCQVPENMNEWYSENRTYKKNQD